MQYEGSIFIRVEVIRTISVSPKRDFSLPVKKLISKRKVSNTRQCIVHNDTGHVQYVQIIRTRLQITGTKLYFNMFNHLYDHIVLQ